MLSKLDIEKELSTNINIIPFNESNIKENSINLCCSKFAWATNTNTIYINHSTEEFSLMPSPNFKMQQITKGTSSCVKIKRTNYIILLPLSTTLVETNEVLSVGATIGGTFHSKVGIASQGVGHIGTMLGPNFSGHCLISLHNPTSQLIILKEKDSFVSVVFHYLKRPLSAPNPTSNGHIDKFSVLGIRLKPSENDELNADWKSNIAKVQEKMIETSQFKEFKKRQFNRNIKTIKRFLNWQNFLVLSVTLGLIILSYEFCSHIDIKNGNTIWQDRFITVGFSGIFIPILAGIKYFIKKS